MLPKPEMNYPFLTLTRENCDLGSFILNLHEAFKLKKSWARIHKHENLNPWIKEVNLHVLVKDL